MPTIEKIEDENLFMAYRAARDEQRGIMAYGVYPNAVAALASYDALLVRLSTGGDLADFDEFHSKVTSAVGPYITIMYQAMQTIVQTMQAIEKAAPNTFGIQLPVEEPKE